MDILTARAFLLINIRFSTFSEKFAYRGAMLLSAILAFFPMLHGAQDVATQLPFSQDAIERIAEETIAEFDLRLTQFLNIPVEERTFENTVRLADVLEGGIVQAYQCLQGLLDIYPEKELRDCADRASRKLERALYNAVAAHPEMYQVCLDIQKHSLNETERNYLEQLLFRWGREGMQLTDAQREQAWQIKQEIASLSSQFFRNVTEDIPVFFASREDLAGMSAYWIDALPLNASGQYQISCDLPTFRAVLSNCSVRKTRIAVFERFNNRAFPQNEKIARELIAKKDALAKLFGFASFAEYELRGTMALSTARVKEFLKEMKKGAREKAALEFKMLIEDLPEGVVLNSLGQLELYDEYYAFNCYKEKHFSVFPRKIAEYFPMKNTIDGLIAVYAQFFDLSIEEVPHSIPIPDLKALEIRNRSGKLLGVVLLDLFFREGKCGHSGVCHSLISPFSPGDGTDYTALTLVIGNSPQPPKGRPSLMSHSEVTTFFHEFGHAIHNVLARSLFFSFCGCGGVKSDFVEVPSLLLENWVRDPAILRQISSHYLTGEPLPEEWIQNLLQSRRFGWATIVERACFLSDVALAYFAEGEKKQPAELFFEIGETELPQFSLGENNHFFASWWHLPSYGPKYYSYLWSQVFASDLFEKIYEGGLLNPEVGTAYVDGILSRGGSDALQLVSEFLGREPSVEPFFKQLVH